MFTKLFGPNEVFHDFLTHYKNPYKEEELVAIVENSGHRVDRIRFDSDDDCGGVMTSYTFYSAREYLEKGEEILSQDGMAIMDRMSIYFSEDNISILAKGDSICLFSEDKNVDLNDYLFPKETADR